MKPITAMLLKDIRINVPNTNLTIIAETDSIVKVDPDTQIAWIRQYQVELERGQYTFIC